MAYANGRIYMFGGELEPRVPVPAATYVYDLASGIWSKLATAGDSRGHYLAQSRQQQVMLNDRDPQHQYMLLACNCWACN
jgi:hypothetical protein